MALDISESAVYSWLHHIKKYSIVHNNWKLSPCCLKEYSKEKYAIELFDKFDKKWSGKYPQKLWKNTLQQTLRQAECDAIGIKIENDSLKIAVVEVACHTDGLLYGDKQKTADKVVRKCVLDIIMVYLCFGKTDLEVFFVSPFVRESVIESVIERVNEANDILKELDIEIELVFNENYKTTINDPLSKLISEKTIRSTEDSEDYLRGLMISECIKRRHSENNEHTN